MSDNDESGSLFNELDRDAENEACAFLRERSEAAAGQAARKVEAPDDDERVARLVAMVTPLGYGMALALVKAETEMLAASKVEVTAEMVEIELAKLGVRPVDIGPMTRHWLTDSLRMQLTLTKIRNSVDRSIRDPQTEGAEQ